MKRVIFAVAFLLVCAAQGMWWTHEGIYDAARWGNEAQYVETGNPEEFDTDAAYGHPGGPIIIGTSAVHAVTGISYVASMYAWLTILDAVLIGAICTLCFALRKDLLWVMVAGAMLAISPLYLVSTPPSAAASLFAVLLALCTLYLYERADRRTNLALAAWTLVAGLMVSTRADIGALSTAIFALLLLPALGIKRIGAMLAGAFAAFCLFDPFMWFMPIRHLEDLFVKVHYQYAQIPIVSHLSPSELLFASCFALIAIALSLLSLARRKVGVPLPTPFVLALLVITAILSCAVLTAQYQAIRYFQPVIFIWEAFLPLLLFWHIKTARLPAVLIPLIGFVLICYPLTQFLIYAR